jgi:glyoxylate reductase
VSAPGGNGARPRLFVTRRLAVDAAAVAGPAVEVRVFAPPGPERPPTREELLAGARGAAGLVTLLSDAVDVALLDALPGLRVVANHAVGVDNVDLAAATARGVWVTNTPDVLTDATADLTWALLLAVARRLREGEALLRGGGFHGWSPTLLLGLELRGRTLGVFGFGRIGRAVARRAAGFGMDVLYTSRRPVPPAEASGARAVDKAELLAHADVLSVHCPLSAETHHAVGAAELARMKRGAILVNTARGPIVDEGALSAALAAGHLGGAGLDVYEDEPAVHPGLLGRHDVVLLPHVGSATHEARRRMAELALGDAARVVRGERPLHPVNAPALRA